jgi:serine/threonine-protein phosphatase 2A activator
VIDLLSVCGCQAVQAILGILDEVEKIVQATPPVDNAASRFGNPAFKTFYDKVEEVSVVYILGSGMI